MASVVRYPTIVVNYGPTAGSQTAITNVLKAHHANGLDMTIGEASFSVPTVGDLHGATYWSVVNISLSATGAGPVWYGYIVEFDYSLFPREIGVICKGFLVRAQLMQNNTATALPPGGTDMVGAGATDQAIVLALLGTCGLVDGGVNPPHLQILGTPQTLGTIAPQSFRWAEGQSALDYIAALDAMSVDQSGGGTWEGFRTYDDLEGSIQRVPIVAVPSGAPSHIFTEGVDIFSGSTQQSILPAKNRIIVTGYDAGNGAGPVIYTLAVGNTHIPTPPQYIAQQLSSPMIEKQLIADGSPTVGISAEAVTNYLMTQFNRTQVKVSFTTPRDDVLLIAQTIAVQTGTGSADRLGVYGDFFLQRVERDVDESGTFTQSITCLSGAS